MQFTGVQLITGSEMKNPISEESSRIPSEPFAVLALFALLAGILFSILYIRGEAIASAIAGGVATVSLLVLKARMDADITKQASGMPVTVEYLIGFWLALLAAVAGLALSIMRTKEKQKEAMLAILDEEQISYVEKKTL